MTAAPPPSARLWSDSGKLKWEMSQTTAQAAAYGRASDTEGRVVLATNADHITCRTGAPHRLPHYGGQPGENR